MLSRIVMVPYDLVTAPFRASNSLFQDTARGRAMMLGLPAVLVALFGIGVLSWAEFGNKKTLISSYNSRAEKAAEEKNRLIKEINTERKMSTTRQQSGDPSVAVDDEDPRLGRVAELNEQEETYLNKLIWLESDEPDYRYRLAIVAAQRDDPKRCYSLMKSIAPDDEPGYAKAHFWVATNYLQQRATSGPQQREYRRLALTHINHCLVRDDSNLDAKLLKAQLLALDRRFEDSYKMYEELFEQSPKYYKPLVELNKIKGGENLTTNSIILDQAQRRFKEAVDEASVDYGADWAPAWANLIVCVIEKRDYQLGAELLSKEEEIQSKLVEAEGTPEAASRHVHIKRLLTELYTSWAGALASSSDSIQSQTQQLELLKRALSFDENYPGALQLVARLSVGDTELAAEAKKLYDPEKHDDAPARVLNEMGSWALGAEKYDMAIKYFELARRKDPNDPLILNNLAYAYLVCENRNPDRALTLVNQAIRAIPSNISAERREELASHFYDTKGRALLQMNRMDEAAASLELAMRSRPKNKDILAALIKCYEGRDDIQADVYRQRLEAIEADTGNAGGE